MSTELNSVRAIRNAASAVPRGRGAEAVGTVDGVRTIGRYALHSEIAAGGMATVHIGRLLGPVGFARTVAIKRLHPPLAKDPEFVAMFLDEARLAARIRHPNVVSTLDVVATEGELFVVMEYVAGESLARLLRAVRSNKDMVPVPIAASIMVGVLHGLHAAHEARDERGAPLRIVHRDVSPHNILVGTDGDAHVIDFGIAKARGRMQVTRQGQIKGKLSYMPAEQLLGQPLDHRADIFAASIVFWEALTGQRLFEGVDDGEVYAKLLLGKVDPPSLHARELGPEIDAIVLRGLARDRTKRYATAREMALAIEAAIPLAPPSQVGRWVEGLAVDSLAERTEQIAGIERIDDGDPGMTSSALMSIGVAGTPAANENETANEAIARAGSLARVDRTAPTQPAGLQAVGSPDPQATAVDRPVRPRRIEDPVVEVAATSRGRSRRFAVAGALLFISLSCYGVWRMVRVAPEAVTSGPTEGRASEPQNASSVGSFPSTLGLGKEPPAQTLAPSNPAAPAANTNVIPSRKASPTSPPSLPSAAVPRQSPPRAPTSQTGTSEGPAAAPAARGNGASCDPPFWIDADGTKRYNRHCANL